jgi:1,4-dihydroxy-2-naphthoate polyprenyltransferase
VARTPKQQRIDPDAVDRGVAERTGAARASSATSGGSAKAGGAAKAGGSSGARGAAATPKKGRPTPKRPKGPARDDLGRVPTKPAKPKSGAPDRPAKATPRDWIAGARPQTLALAIAPVVLGVASSAAYLDEWYAHWVRALLCLVVAVALQIGVNFANDYSDGIRGTDAVRQGPRRLVGSGAAKPATVRNVAFAFFGVAAVAGVAIVVATGHWWLLAVGAVSIVAAWFYTGGRRPYGYAALGEVAVFVFFGLVATAGTTFVQLGEVSFEAWVLGSAAGLFACAVLMANNLRDLARDRDAGKRTLAVVVGPVVSRVLYAVFLLAPFALLVLVMPLYFNLAYVFFALIVALPAVAIVATARTARELVLALRLSVLTALVYALAVGALLAF